MNSFSVRSRIVYRALRLLGTLCIRSEEAPMTECHLADCREKGRGAGWYLEGEGDPHPHAEKKEGACEIPQGGPPCPGGVAQHREVGPAVHHHYEALQAAGGSLQPPS